MAEHYDRNFPVAAKRITTGCQYCAVGCGYNALLVSEAGGEHDKQGDLSRFITPAMRGVINFQGVKHYAAIAPDVRCDLNKGNHSVRGGSQGHNLVTHDQMGRSTKQRLKSPMVRLSDKRLHEISWPQLYEIMAQLVVKATRMRPNRRGNRLSIRRREALGVKLYEYQYLENTYAATKLFYSAIGTPNLAYHDRPSAADSSPGLADTGFRAHGFAYDDVRYSDVLLFIGTNPYENQSVFFMQYCQGKRIVVIDPRRTATADYAVRTGGIHLQPTKLGADSLVLHALAREIIKSWTSSGHALDQFPVHALTGSDADVAALPVDTFDRRRRASRALSFARYAQEFLQIDDDDASPYSLQRAADKSGIPIDQLAQVAATLFDPRKSADDQPRAGICYEKGMIWGFNYQNTSAVGALGLLLRAYNGDRGRFVGRVGGHQKGWAESRSFRDLEFIQRPRRRNRPQPESGYPFFESQDSYSDRFLVDLRERPDVDSDTIVLKHNLDNHVFGPPDGFEHENQDDVRRGFVRLKTGLVTRRKPDVRLLWIIGNNYLGQTNDAQRKRHELQRRREGSDLQLPESADTDEIVRVLSERLERRNGIVLVHQDVFANATTEFCDLVIPAAGWGEDDFIRYNAQRRLKLYARFQDMPLHAADDVSGDPMSRIDDFVHSPKPDWIIFRDIARTVGRVLDREFEIDQSNGFEVRMRHAFSWCNSSELCDEMAQLSNRNSMLGDLYTFGREQGVPVTQGAVHRVLGKKSAEEPQDALAPMLKTPGYSVPDASGANESEVYGNAVATNGVLLPARLKDGQLQGTLSQGPKEPRLFFINASWSEIEPYYEAALPGEGELFITNGRFNHLWNNMFHHVRNEYVNERYPEDLPGTVLEVNPVWADGQGIRNGQVVDVTSAGSRFRAIVSLQDSVPESGAFAMFSYPVREGLDESNPFNFDGYVNNTVFGYADGVNPIGALKYGRGVVAKVPHPTSGDPDWVFPRDFPDRVPRLGPTFEPRNRIGPTSPPSNRADWELRELIVTKGLPRAFINREFRFATLPHLVTSGPHSGEATGRFWQLEGLTPEAFLQLSVFGERMDRELLNRLESDMPSGMLQSDELPTNSFTQDLFDRIRAIMDSPETFDASALREIQELLDALIDIPHRAVIEQFLDPDRFLETLKSNQVVRDRFMARLNSDVRRMVWQSNGILVDEWQPGELKIARDWYWDQ